MPLATPAPRGPLSGREFERRLRGLVALTWGIPPVFGLAVIILIGTLTPRQVLGILVTPLEPIYIVGWLLFARRVRAVLDKTPG